MIIDAPMQVVASDMTAFWAAGKYWELTLCMDLSNNEIASHAISSSKGDRNTCIDGLKSLPEKKNWEYPGLKTILHPDQGAVYPSKDFNDILPAFSITRSMSRAGTQTDNGAMEAINGWAKEEMFAGFNIGRSVDVSKAVREYVGFLNRERPSFALDCLTSAQYKERYWKQNFRRLCRTNRGVTKRRSACVHFFLTSAKRLIVFDASTQRYIEIKID